MDIHSKYGIDILGKNSPVKLLLICLIIAVFIIYPNISFYSMQQEYLGESKQTAHLLFFIFRYIFFSILIWILILYNLRRVKTPAFRKRLIQTLVLSVIAYFIYTGATILFNPKPDWHSSILFLQFFIVFLFCTLIGHVFYLYSEHRKKEHEIERLKIENLQSRYVALTNQINPHFFFNSLNGLTSVIRKKNEKNTLKYVNKLSDVFRYILQSEKKGLITLKEELEFIQAFRYMLEIRFASKLTFDINVNRNKKDFKIPVLSLLPLIENVVMHNIIDSEHKMNVTILLNNQSELVVSNPVFPKLSKPVTNGTGLKNLEKRFTLLMNKHIRIEDDGTVFSVYLPLKLD